MKINRAGRAFPAGLLALTLSAVVTGEGRKSDPQRKEPPKPVLKVSSSSEEKISLDVKDADIRDVLRVFSMLTHANLAIDPEVKGSVTLRLEDVRWQDALDVMLRSNGFAAQIEGNIIRVATPAKLAGERPDAR
jgi:type IV pilus assembly protein PilQ